MKHLPLIILLLFMSHFVGAQNYLNKDDLPESFYKHLKGKIVREYPKENAVNEMSITMNMRRRGDAISGTYFYQSDTLSLSLNGYIMNEGVYQFEAVDPNFNVKGNFRGKFRDSTTLEGRLMVPRGSKKETWLFTLNETYEKNVDFKVFQFNDKHYINGNPDYPYINFKVDFLYPKSYKDPQILDKLQVLVEKEFFGKYAMQQKPMANIKKKRNEAFAEYKQYVEQNYQYNPDNVQYYIWKSEYVADVIYNSDNILTIKINSQEIVGGEAQFGGVNYLVVDLTNGEPIRLADIFKEGYNKALATVITEKIKEDYDIKANYELIESNFLVDMIEPNENYYIDRKGIGFYFSPYAINEFEVRIYISYRDLGDILKKKSPISKFFPDQIEFGDMQHLVQAREEILQLSKTIQQQQMPDPNSSNVQYPQSAEGEEESGGVVYPGEEGSGNESGGVTYPGEEGSGNESGGVTYPGEEGSGNESGGVTYPGEESKGEGESGGVSYPNQEEKPDTGGVSYPEQEAKPDTSGSVSYPDPQ